VGYFGPLITRLTEAYFKGWLGRYILYALDFESVLLIQPLFAVLLGYTAYHYVYKLEKKYALKVVTCITFLQACFMAYSLNRSAHFDWCNNYHVEIMIREALLFYATLFYFITSYRWYSRVSEYKSIIRDLGCCFLGLALVLFSGDWVSIFCGWAAILWIILPDQIQQPVKSYFNSKL
jgi:hypothetical protein